MPLVSTSNVSTINTLYEEVTWTTFFHTVGVLQSFPKIGCISIRRTTQSNYVWDGAERGSGPLVFQYTLEGEGRFRDGSGEYGLPPGTGFLCHVADPEICYWYPVESGRPWRFLFVDFYQADAMVQEIVQRYGAIFEIPASQAIIQRLLRFQTAYPIASEEISAMAGALLLQQIFNLLVRSKEKILGHNPDLLLVRKARDAIRERIGENLKVCDLASALSITPSHLARVFRQELNQPPLEFIRKEKVFHACRLLQQTTLSVKEVADQVGFSDCSNFARSFRKVMHVSPKTYRLQEEMP